MSKIMLEKRFTKIISKGEKALITYITCGDPTLSHTYKIAKTIVENGADVLELGIPFSDPVADGVTIQSASQRALKHKITPIECIKAAGEIKQELKIPIVILTYFNPIFKIGLEDFFKLIQEAGLDGVIVPDLPIEEAHEYKLKANEHNVNTIFLVAPSTTPNRLKKITSYCSGFLYLVSVFGVTGARGDVQKITLETIRKVKHSIKNQLPLAVGFGISKPEHGEKIINAGADGIIVGSAIIKKIEKNISDNNKMLNEIGTFVKNLKSAII